MEILYHGSPGMVGEAFDPGTWCTPDMVQAVCFARQRGGDLVYVFVGMEGIRKYRKYYRLQTPRKPDACMKIVNHNF